MDRLAAVKIEALLRRKVELNMAQAFAAIFRNAEASQKSLDHRKRVLGKMAAYTLGQRLAQVFKRRKAEVLRDLDDNKKKLTAIEVFAARFSGCYVRKEIKVAFSQWKTSVTVMRQGESVNHILQLVLSRAGYSQKR